MNNEIPVILSMEKEWMSEYRGDKYFYSFGDTFIDKPSVTEEDRIRRPLYPTESTLREMAYDCKLYVDIHERIESSDGTHLGAKVYEKRLLSELPCMVGSDFCNLIPLSPREKVLKGECPITPGGWFVTAGGTQRVITGQERSNYNHAYAFSGKKGEYQIDVRSTPEMGIKPILFRINYKKKKLTVSTPFIDDFPLSIFLRAINCELETEFMDTSITPSEACEKMEISGLKNLLVSDFLPHIEKQENKSLFVIMMAEKLLQTVNGDRVEDDRDDFANKRLDWAGFLLRYLFRLLLKKWILKFQTQMSTRGNAKAIIEDNDVISKGIGMCMRTGNWGVQNIRTGVSQVAEKMNIVGFVSHLRRFTTPGVREGKMMKIRFLHPSQWGIACISETPEGSPTGVVKNLALLCSISVYTSHYVPIKILNGMVNVISLDCKDNTHLSLPKIFVNGDWIAVMETEEECIKLKKQLMEYKTTHIIHRETSIVWDYVDKELRINTDSGRPIRPVFVLEDGIPVLDNKNFLGLSWDELIYRGFITYIDSAETSFNTIATSLDEVYDALKSGKFHFDYAEIHPSIIIGAASGIIPLPDHSQAPRNVFGCLDHNEEIYMADGTYKAIKDIKVGDFVYTIDPVTCEKTITDVINQYVRPTTKAIVKVITESGRELTVTDDHPFLTLDGWKPANQFKPGDLMAITKENAKEKKIIEKGDCLFVPIKSVTPQPNVLISDITTRSENHSFITKSGFVVHNSSMLKQGQASVGYNINVRFDTTSYMLNYPQKQMCPTTTAKIIGHEDNPTGCNAIVAICEGDGFNQEDSVIVNKAAIDRGLLRSTIYHSYSVSEKRSGTKQSEIIKIPQKSIMSTLKNYNKLDIDGIVPEGTPVEPGDVLIGKVITNGTEVIDSSHVVKSGEGGIVDKVLITTGSDKLKLVKIRIREYHIPEAGDKLASQVGQKSTIGLLCPQEDMPFNMDGMSPDIIIHPPALPSRMTINFMIQGICGKTALITGDASDKFRDMTPFRNDMNGEFIAKEVGKGLVANGFEACGTEVMTCGKTGRTFKTRVFMGVVYYQALKHMVSKKIHSRSSGKVQVLTGQPISGRSKNGGMRIGEMERDCFIAHGCSSVIRERLVEVSDKYVSQVCLGCGAFCIGQCKACKKQTKTVIVPYAIKLLFQELMAFGIFPKIQVE